MLPCLMRYRCAGTFAPGDSLRVVLESVHGNDDVRRVGSRNSSFLHETSIGAVP
jgi:hypothetical protein